MATYLATLAKIVDNETEFIYPKTTSEIVQYTDGITVKEKLDELEAVAEAAQATADAAENTVSEFSNKIEGLESTAVSCTLSSSSWSGSSAPYTQTLTVSGLESSQNGILGLAQGLTANQMKAASAAMIGISSQSSGSLVVAAYGEKPTIDIPVVVTLIA